MKIKFNNWQERFIAHQLENLNRDTEITPMTSTPLTGMHADLIITDFPHYKWNRVRIFDRRKRLKRK